MKTQDQTARRAKVLAELDRLRREHYGDMPLTKAEREVVESVAKIFLGQDKHPAAKVIRDEYLKQHGWKEGDELNPVILRRILMLYLHGLKMNGGDIEACRLEDESLAHELSEALGEAPLREYAASLAIDKLKEAVPAPPPRKGGRIADPRRAKFFTLMQEQGLNASRPDCRNFLKQHPEAKELFIDQDNLRTQFLNWLKKKP